MIERIGFGRRSVAWIIDLSIWHVVMSLYWNAYIIYPKTTGIIISTSFYRVWDTSSSPYTSQQFVFLVGGYFFGALQGLIEAITGASLGKMVLGMRIGNEDGTRATKWTIGKRTLFKHAPLPFLLISLIFRDTSALLMATSFSLILTLGCLPAVDSSRQALHDKLYRTALFRTKSLVSGSTD